MLTHLFPLGSIPWLVEIKPEQCPEKIASWLYDKRSLTKKLERLCRQFSVQVRQQTIVNVPDHSLSGYFSNETKILVREVFLYCDNLPVVFAQTEIPLSTLTEQQAQLAEIGSQSLGNILFQDPSMKRGAIEIAQLTDKSMLAPISPEFKQNYDHPLWARRSLFYLNDNPLLVSELFLPAATIYLR
ncbi:MAG: chorismate--pyruvate lyase [Psychromonas sp.]|jgi:chorismate--pyruvate lyase|uniref:chorismate--pyruvate lyase family protein n=1 Tax=Psychromonas sp. TaxID=1884585 RepID=UPI0039E51C62